MVELTYSEDFLDYFNTNRDSDDRSKDDAISESIFLPHTTQLTRQVVSLEGRMFPVEVAYLREPCADYARQAVQTVFDIHLKVCAASSPNVLVLTTGTDRRHPCIFDGPR